jgi:outer membrane immunogenic protein
MKRLVLASLALLPLAFGPAQAADMHVKALPPVPVGYSWTGCYLGGYIGGAWDGGGSSANDAVNTVTGTAFNGGGPYSIPYKPNVIGGGTLGCNYQVGVFVFGAEGEYGYLHQTSSYQWPNSPPVGGNGDTNYSDTIGNWYGVAALRLGLANDRVMWYLKGGAAWTHVSSSVVDTCTVAPCGPATLNASGSSNPTGWAAGGGIEWAFLGNWTWKAEALVLGFNKGYAVCGPETPAGVNFCSNHAIGTIATVKMGLNYKFDWGAPVVARY